MGEIRSLPTAQTFRRSSQSPTDESSFVVVLIVLSISILIHESRVNYSPLTHDDLRAGSFPFQTSSVVLSVIKILLPSMFLFLDRSLVRTGQRSVG